MVTTTPGGNPEPSGLTGKNDTIIFLLLFAGIIAVMVIADVVFVHHFNWTGHAFTGVIAFGLLVLVIVTGAIRSGRIKRLHFRRVHIVHKTAGVCFTGVTVGTFFLGLLVEVGMGDPFLSTPHGVIGLILAVLSTFQMVRSLLVTKRPSIRKIHMIIGYLIIPLFIIQVFLGIESAELLKSGSG